MAKRKVIIMPHKVLPFARAVRAGDFIFTSGAGGTMDARGNPVEGIEAQPRQCLEKTKQVLQATDSSFGDVCGKSNHFLS